MAYFAHPITKSLVHSSLHALVVIAHLSHEKRGPIGFLTRDANKTAHLLTLDSRAELAGASRAVFQFVLRF